MILLSDAVGRRGTLLHPGGLTFLTYPERRHVLAAGIDRIDGELISWACGWVQASDATPTVAFSRWGHSASETPVRRLSATSWAAQATGRWTRVRIA